MKWLKRSAKEAAEPTVPATAEIRDTESNPEAATNALVAHLEAIDEGRDPFRFQTICGKIGEAREVGAVPRLLDLLGRNGREGLAPENRRAAVQALGSIADPAAVDALVKELQFVPSYAAAALGRIGDKRAVEPLLSLLRSDDWPIRSAAAGALGVLGDTRATAPLRELENDARAEVQRAVEVALAKLGESGDGWFLDTVDTQHVGDRLVALGIVDGDTVAKMCSLGTYRLCATGAPTQEAPGTAVLTNAQFGDGVCGSAFVVDRIALSLESLGRPAVAEVTCPDCGTFFELKGVAVDSEESVPEVWLVTNLVSSPDRFLHSPYLGWPRIDHATVDFESVADTARGFADSCDIVEVGTERKVLIDAGVLGAGNIDQFSIYRIKAAAGTILKPGDAIAVSGVEVCGVCLYEVPLDTSIGLKGFFDYKSKQVVVCPRCDSSSLVVGVTTTSTSGGSRYWLLAVQETGPPGAGVHPSGGRPELRIGKAARATS